MARRISYTAEEQKVIKELVEERVASISKSGGISDMDTAAPYFAIRSKAIAAGAVKTEVVRKRQTAQKGVINPPVVPPRIGEAE